MNNKMSNDILFNIIFGNSGSGGGGGGDNPFIPPTGYKTVGLTDGYPVPRINLRSACVNDLGFPFSLGIDDDTVQAGDKILVVGQSTDDGTPFAVWGTVDSTRTAGNYFIARLTVEGSAIRTDAAYVVDISANGGTLVFGATKVNVNVPNPSSGSIEITENGTYNVTDKASAVVNVENSYTASDEGKVVDNGALVSQTSQNISSNGTYDTTTKNEVVVNVPSSGVSEKWAQLHDANTADGSVEITDADLPANYVMEAGAFSNNVKIKSFDSSTITSIPMGAFNNIGIPYDYSSSGIVPVGNSQLTSVNAPNVTSIGVGAFAFCEALTTMGKFDKVTAIGMNAFYYAKLPHCNFPALTTMDKAAFSHSTGSDVDVVMPSVTSIPASAFNTASGVKNATFAAATSVGSSAFYSDDNLVSFSAPLCTSIGAGAFSGCTSLVNLNVPACTTLSSTGTFTRCTSLVYADLPLVDSIKATTFSGCTALKWVHIGGTAGSLVTLAATSAFNNCPTLEHIYVPDALVEDYKVATNWSTYAAKITPESEMPTV